jgi:hypothetical protein
LTSANSQTGDEGSDPEDDLGKYLFGSIFRCQYLITSSGKLKRTWRSPVYTFFNLDDISVQVHDGRPCQFFPCAARKCKTAIRGIRRYQDSTDKASTANLRHHAMRCFGEDTVCNAVKGDNKGQSGSIFASFAHQGQKPVLYSHRSHTNPEVR